MGVPSNRTLQTFTDPQGTISPQRNVNAAVQPPAGPNTVTAPKFICFHNQLCLILSSQHTEHHTTYAFSTAAVDTTTHDYTFCVYKFVSIVPMPTHMHFHHHYIISVSCLVTTLLHSSLHTSLSLHTQVCTRIVHTESVHA